MRVRLIHNIVFIFLLQGLTFAQDTTVNQPKTGDLSCPNFPMPVIKPEVDESKLPIVKPNSDIDFKLIIVDPCLPAVKQEPIFLFPIAPKENSNLQNPTTEFKFNKGNFRFTPKDNVMQNLIVPKQPK